MKNTVDSCVYFDLGSRVLVGEKAKMPGVLRYLGTVHFVEGIWCGVELDEEEGLHDGMVQGIRYFTCPPNKGVLAPLCRVQPMTCSSLERNRNHGVLFDCPFEDVPQSSPSRSSRLPRPAYSASTRHGDKTLVDLGQHKSFDVECLLDVKNQEARMRKSASPKKVTFDMEPEFMEGDSEFRWKKSRSEYDSLHSFENEINCNFQEQRNVNSLEEDLVNFNCPLTTSGDIKPCIAIRPKSVSASLDAVESDLNELLQKIDKEISNVKTPDTAEIGIFAPDFFVDKRKKKHAMKQEIDFFQDDDDYVDGISSERSDKLRDQRKVDEAGDDDIMLLTGSPTFRLAQTAMVQYAELLKASQAGLVAQKIRYQNPSKSNKIVSDMDNSSSVEYSDRKVAVEQLDSPLKIRRVHLDSSNSTSSSNDDVYETFEGEDLCTLKVPPDCELNCNEATSSMAMSFQNIETAASNQPEATSEDVCNFLDSLLKSGRELEKWLEISVADLKSDAATSGADSCKNETKAESPNTMENCVRNEPEDFTGCTETSNVTGIDILSQSDILLEDISKTRPLSYASTVDSSDTGCQMELDDDITKSFNVEESLIDLGTQSDSLLLESWNEIFKPDTARQRIESIEKSVLDYLDLGAIESTARESSEIVPTSTNLIEFDCEIRHNVHSDGTPLAPSNGEELKPIHSLADSKTNLSNPQPSKEVDPIPSSDAKSSFSVTSAESHVLLLNEVKIMNSSFDNLQLSSMQTFVDEATSDSQEANASGLSSTPGSSFSSYASSQKDQDLLPHDVLSGSLDGCLLHSIEETFVHLDEPTSSVITNSLVNGLEDDDDDGGDDDYDDDEYVSWKKLETNDHVSDPVVPLEPFVSDELKSHLKDDPGKVNDEPCNEILQPPSNLRKGDNPAVKSTKLKNDVKNAQTNIGSKPPLKVSTNRSHKNLVNQTKSSKMSLPKVVTIKSGVEKPSGKVDSEAKTRNSSDSRTKKPIHQSPTKVSSSTKSASPRASKSNAVSSMSSSLTSQTSTGLSNKTVFVRSQPQNSVSNTSAKSSKGTSSKQTKSCIPSAREVKQNLMKPLMKVDAKLTSTKSEPNRGLAPVKDVMLSSTSTFKKRGMLSDQKPAVLTSGRRQNETEDKGKQSLRSGSAASKMQTPGNSKLNLKDSNNPVNHSTLPAMRPLLSGKQASNGCVKRQLPVPKGYLDSKAMKNAKNTTMASGKKVTSNDSLISEVTDLKNQLNEAKKLADQYHKESKDFEKLVSTQEKQYKERITRFEKALEDRLAWLKSDLEIKHDSFVKELTDKHECDMVRLKEASGAKTRELEKAIEEAKASYEKEMNDLKAERDKTIADLNENHAREMEELTQKYEASVRSLEDSISSVQKALDKSLARERSAQDAAKLDRDLRQQALLEIDSLGVVVESKNSELKKMRLHNSALEEKLNEIPALKEKMVSMQRKIEQLEMALASKTEHEKELLDTKQKLLKKSKEGDEAVRKLSMNNEELIWRLSQSELGSPILKDRHPFSPTHSPISPMSKSAISFSTPIRK